MKKLTILTILAILVSAAFIPLTVLAAPLHADVDISADDTTKTGLPGSVVQFTLTLHNNTAGDLTLAGAAATTGGWTAPSLFPAAFTVGAGADQFVTVNAPIPADATNGQNDVVTVTFTDGTVTASIMLTVEALVPVVEPTAVTGRPLLVVESYSAGGKAIQPGAKFNLGLTVKNIGAGKATNVVAVFTSAELLPQETGGVVAGAALNAGKATTLNQPMLASEALWGATYGTVTVAVTYSDLAGASYTENFTVLVNLAQPVYSGYANPTATPTAVARPQLVIGGYAADVDPLQPGTIFNLKLDVINLGLADARSITMVLGGGVSTGGDGSGTPQPGGVSGAGGDLTNFAPLGSSNLTVVGELAAGASLSNTLRLIVNTNTAPGAYPVKFSFVYTDSKGNRLVDDQVITLLVYSLPQVEVGYYRDPGMVFANQMTSLPLQVTNLGRKTAVLGNMKVMADNSDVTNNVGLVGTLEPGGYFTLDVNLMPYAPGPLEVNVVINYTDDFNQPRMVEQTLVIDVIDMPTPEAPIDGEGMLPEEPQPETFWQWLGRLVKGLFGLGSGTDTPVDGGMPTDESQPVYPSGPKG